MDFFTFWAYNYHTDYFQCQRVLWTVLFYLHCSLSCVVHLSLGLPSSPLSSIPGYLLRFILYCLLLRSCSFCICWPTSFRRTVAVCKRLSVVVCLAWWHMHTDEISCCLEPQVLWVPIGPSTIFAENPPVCDPVFLSPVPFFHQRSISLVTCANGNLQCLIIITLSLGFRRRSGALCACSSVCVCVCSIVGVQSCWASVLLWESSHNPSLSEYAISIHYSPSTQSPRHITACMDTRIMTRNRKDTSGVLAS